MDTTNRFKKFPKKLAFYILFPILFVGALLFAEQGAKERYSLDFSGTDVESISLYYEAEAQKKEITDTDDIQTIVDSLCAMELMGAYSQIEDGTLGFCLVFHFSDDREFVCLYGESNKNPLPFQHSGYFTDGEINVKVRGVSFYALWNSLDVPIVTAVSDDEVSSILSLS